MQAEQDGAGPYCDRCGGSVVADAHAGCARARELEPPRYCARCRRRMIVQVTPEGWVARCSEHGVRTSVRPRR
ncbi:MAG: hypothetical protein DLM58_08435 [Pseudonocardiales bacterium]|nr:MAG: hypothetical protein DLM58_08435 [Pseudonocardiales bacterium]